MSASALAAIWIAALLPGTAVIVLVLVKRAAGARDSEARQLGAPALAHDGDGAPTNGAPRPGDGYLTSSVATTNHEKPCGRRRRGCS